MSRALAVVVPADPAIKEFDQPYTDEAMAGRLSGALRLKVANYRRRLARASPGVTRVNGSSKSSAGFNPRARASFRMVVGRGDCRPASISATVDWVSPAIAASSR